MIFTDDFQTSNKKEIQSPPINGLADAQAVIFKALAEALKPPPKVDFGQWSANNITFGSESPFPGKFNPDLFPFYKKVLRCLEPDHPAREVVLMGSSQTGKTVCAQAFAGGSLDLDPGPFMYIHPTLENAARWGKTKWKPFVIQSPALRRIFPAETKSRDTSSSTYLKERVDGRGHLLISGANSASSLSMVTAAKQVQDDLSKWEDNEHGDPEIQADGRSQGFGNWAKIFKISSPSIMGVCKIYKNYQRSNRQKYELPCPHCEYWHSLEWDNLKQSLKEGMDLSEAHFTCPDCGGVIEHHHKEWMLDQSLLRDSWKADNPDSKIEGFYIWCAYSRAVNWAFIADKYFKSLGDPEQEKAFMTDTIGLPYEQKGDSPPWQDLAARAAGSDYLAGTIPAGALLITIGCDVQADRVEWKVKGWGKNLRRWTIQHGIIDGHISEDTVQKQMDALLARKWRNVHGRMIGVDMLAIDANWETNEVKAWARRQIGRAHV